VTVSIASVLPPGVSVRALVNRLVVGWATLALALLFLDVPFKHAVLVAAMLLSQAALGAAFLIRVVGISSPSLLLICGPGLIVGGALSFALFQLGGRGVTGLAIALGLGLASSVYVLARFRAPNSGAGGAVVMAHVAGLTALAMSSEFKWLLIVAATLLVVVAAVTSNRQKTVVKLRLIFVLGVFALLLARQLRGTWWWLVTDDYKFFQVIAEHVTTSGPFADWGFLNFSRYHWLSYGWSGLLDYVALNPDPLVILTRVMPLVYSVALGSSLLLVTESVSRRAPLMSASFLPAAIVIVMLPLDWTGTSTAGAVSVLAAFVAVLCLAIDVRSQLPCRVAIYATFGSIAVLTKLPSALMLLPLVVASEMTVATRGRHRPRHLVLTASAVTAAGLVVLLSLPALSELVGSFTLQWGSQRGDELRNHTLLTSIIIVSGRRSWLFALVAIAWLFHRIRSRSEATSDSERMLLGLVPLLFVGASLDATVVGTANTNEYFSHPSYFLASTAVLVFANTLDRSWSAAPWMRVRLPWALAATAAIAASLLLQQVSLPGPSAIDIIQGIFDDPRTIFGAVLLAWSIRTYVNRSHAATFPIITMLVLFGLTSISPSVSQMFEKGIRPTLSSLELISTVGPPDAETIGRWIQNNTSTDDLVATNYLKNGNDDLGFDYSLAMWSRREFLTYDSFLSFDATAQVNYSGKIEGFAVSALNESAAFLESQGVKWYVVDLATTSRRSWEPHADIVAMTWRLWVLRMR